MTKKDDKLTRIMGFHTPTKGIVYREIKITKKTFNDPKWRKENPGLYDTFKKPISKNRPPLNKYIAG